MKIKTKLALTFIVTLSIAIASIIIFSENIVLAGFEKIENDQIEKNINRFNETLIEEQNAIANTSLGWSTWNETYDFVFKPSQKYLKENYLNIAFFDNKINALAIFDNKNKLLFNSEYDLKKIKFLTLSEKEIEFITNNIISKYKDFDASKTGLYNFNGVTKIYTLNPILKSTDTEKFPSNGKMIFIRDIDKAMISKFERLLKFKIVEMDENYKAAPHKPVYVKEEHEIETEVFISTNLDSKFVEFELIFNRDVYLYGKKLLNMFYLTLTIVSLAIFAIFYLFTNKIITNKIVKISDELVEISNDNNPSSKVSTFDKDEIGLLADNINKSLNKIIEDQQIIHNSSKLASLGEMAGSIAHEINNPLTVIQGHTQKMQKHLKDEEIDKNMLNQACIKIKDNTDRIVKIIKSLKLASRSGENDEKSIYKSKSIIDEINNLYEFNLKQREIKFDIKDFDLNVDLKINFVQILQVFINLINNSVDAIKDKEDKWIKVYSIETNSSFHIFIQDCGDPIPDEIVEKIMQPFFTTKDIGSGTGLGLSIVSKIIENHGGTFEYVKTESHTTFRITLPLALVNLEQKAS